MNATFTIAHNPSLKSLQKTQGWFIYSCLMIVCYVGRKEWVALKALAHLAQLFHTITESSNIQCLNSFFFFFLMHFNKIQTSSFRLRGKFWTSTRYLGKFCPWSKVCEILAVKLYSSYFYQKDWVQTFIHTQTHTHTHTLKVHSRCLEDSRLVCSARSQSLKKPGPLSHCRSRKSYSWEEK